MTTCTRHRECRAVPASGHILENVFCPWCGYLVSTSNPCNWCAECYTIFQIMNGQAHFAKSFRPTLAQAWAMALAKSGGVSISNFADVPAGRGAGGET